jgi:hypothetical protein
MVGACAVDQDVDPSPLLLDLSDETFGGLWIRHVTANRECTPSTTGDRVGSGFRLYLACAIADGDRPLLRRQVERDPPSDAFNPACDERDSLCHG